MPKKEAEELAQKIYLFILLVINNKCIVSDDYLTFRGHSAYQLLMNDTTLIFYNISNPLIDKILLELCHKNFIKRRTCLKDPNNYFEHHFYYLTFQGAWFLYVNIIGNSEIINLFNECNTETFLGDIDMEKLNYLNNVYGPFIALEGF